MSANLNRLIEILSFLRTSPEGCAWSRAQTHASLIPSLIEESYETVEMIDQGKVDAPLCDELGDLLLQIGFHAQIASERGAFAFDDVAKAIVDKLTRRYPTILGDEPNTLKTAEEIDRRWEEVKAEERKRKGAGQAEPSALDDVSSALPALVRAAKLKGRAAKTGWEWPDTTALIGKIAEEAGEIQAELDAGAPKERVAAELGDLLFMLVDFARWNGIDAEEALRQTCARFESRFRHMESGLRRQGLDIQNSDRAQRSALWDEAKKLEK